MFNRFKQRLAGVSEIIDDFSLEGEELITNLKEIEVYNKLLGGYGALLSALDQTIFCLPVGNEYTLLDVGCGGADTMKRVAEISTKRGYKLKMKGIDANPFIVEYAKKQTANFTEIEIKNKNILNDSFFADSYDFVSFNLLLHHFSEDEIIGFIKNAAKKTTKALIICDLHRNFLSYYSFIAIVKLFGANNMTLNDGKISILKGFKKKEWRAILKKAGVVNYQIKWKWAFRHQIIVYCQ